MHNSTLTLLDLCIFLCLAALAFTDIEDDSVRELVNATKVNTILKTLHLGNAIFLGR